MKKRVVILTAAWILAVLLAAGCGNTPEEGSETTAETQEEAPPEESGTEEEVSAPEEAAEETGQDMLTVYLPVKSTSYGNYEESEAPEFWGKSEYEYDEHGNLIKTIGYFEDEDVISSLNEVEYEYDDIGRIVKETSYETPYDFDGNAEGDKVKTSEETYEYDADGILLKSTKTEYFEIEEWELEEMDPEMLLEKRVTESVYDEYGNAVKENILDSHPGGSESTVEFTYEYEYDGNGQMLKATQSRNDDDVKVVREYDEKGNQTEEYQVVPDDSGLTPQWAKCEYTYDEQGRVVKALNRTDWDEDLGNENYPTEYEYDANGNIIRESRKSKTCEYDDDGNVINESYMEDIVEYEYMEMQIPDIKNSHKENKLIIFSNVYFWFG